jgi:hypothetical protein
MPLCFVHAEATISRVLLLCVSKGGIPKPSFVAKPNCKVQLKNVRLFLGLSLLGQRLLFVADVTILFPGCFDACLIFGI